MRGSIAGGRPAEDEQWARFAAERGDARAAFELRRILLARGRREDAIRSLRKAASASDSDAVELLSRSASGPRRGVTRSARATCREARQRDARGCGRARLSVDVGRITSVA